jgi:excisionase family DNA binding protein
MTQGDHSDLVLALLEELRDNVTDLQDRVDHVLKRLGEFRKEYFTVKEVAGLVRRSPYTVRRWLREGRLKGIRIAGEFSNDRDNLRAPYLISRDEVIRLCLGRQQRVDGRGEEGQRGPTSRPQPSPSGRT